jgi:hypothetical protein
MFDVNRLRNGLNRRSGPAGFSTVPSGDRPSSTRLGPTIKASINVVNAEVRWAKGDLNPHVLADTGT